MRSKIWSFQKCLLFAGLALVAFGLSGCGEADSGSSSGGSGSTPKALTSRWYTSNRAWSIDLSSANTTGTPFTANVIMSSEVSMCACTLTLTGSSTSGTYSLGTCPWNNAGSDPTCSSNYGMGTPGSATGSYTATSTTMRFASYLTFY